MKVKTKKGNQRYLFMQEKTKDEILMATKVVNDEWQEMKIFFCNKHKQTFFRNQRLHYGMCWHCKDELMPIDNILIEDIDGFRPIKIYPLQEYHTSDIIVIENYFDSIQELGDNMKVEESQPIEDGKYNGVIKDVVEVKEPYEYTEFVIGFDIEDRKIDLQYGCPSKILVDRKTGKPTSKLATTLDEFGFSVKAGEEITIPDLKKHFVGLKVSSLITSKKTDRGTFAQVVTMIPRLGKK